MSRAKELRDRYGPHALLAVAIALAIIIPTETRAQAWAWLLKGVTVRDVILVFAMYKMFSSVEHRRAFVKVMGLYDKLENGIHDRLSRIEKRLGVEE